MKQNAVAAPVCDGPGVYPIFCPIQYKVYLLIHQFSAFFRTSKVMHILLPVAGARTTEKSCCMVQSLQFLRIYILGVLSTCNLAWHCSGEKEEHGDRLESCRKSGNSETMPFSPNSHTAVIPPKKYAWYLSSWMIQTETVQCPKRVPWEAAARYLIFFLSGLV